MNESRPRERLARLGASALSDVELVALLLGTGTNGESAEQIAQRVVREAGGLNALSQLGQSAMAAYHGVGPAKAARLLAGFEVGHRLVSLPLPRGQPLRCSQDVAAAIRPRLARETREFFVAIAVDSRNRPMSELIIAIGGLTGCALNPADVFRPLVRDAAVGTVFVHNHPSGDPEPSPEDVALTERLIEAGELMGVRVLDHLIVAGNSYFSFADEGLMIAG